MERNLLSADEVVARGNVRGDREVDLAAVVVHEVRAPVVRADETILSDLEPVGGPRLGGRDVVDLGHVDDCRAVVVAADCLSRAVALTGLLVHLDGENVARADLAGGRGRGGAAGVARKVVGGHRGDRRVGGDSANALARLVNTWKLVSLRK